MCTSTQCEVFMQTVSKIHHNQKEISPSHTYMYRELTTLLSNVHFSGMHHCGSMKHDNSCNDTEDTNSKTESTNTPDMKNT